MHYPNSYSQLSPWSSPKDPEIIFPLEEFEKLLFDLGWLDSSAWLKHWLDRGGVTLSCTCWPSNARSDWIWGLGFPFLSDLERYLGTADCPVLFGISGLPGCGKTTFGRWLEAAASELDWSVTVLSMDDFYLPGAKLDQAMCGNPWDVPRGLPGSHSIELLESTIDSWIKTGELFSPQFDKALRDGRGDRSGWRHTNPKVVVIEGWFLGCIPMKENLEKIHDRYEIIESITPREYEYREVVQKSLERYQPIWKRFERIWHLKASKFKATGFWKTEQENQMQIERGASLRGKSLNSFIRMIQTSIPQISLQSIESNVVALVDQERKITWVGNKANQPKMTI